MQKWLSIPLPMRIIIEYKIRCGCGSVIDVPLQSDLALHVTIPLKQDFDLQTLVNQFFNEDLIEDYKCETDNCKGTGAIRYTRLRDPLPTTICIHLQRTFWNGYKMMKIDKTIRFTQILIIKSEHLTFDNIEALHMKYESETSFGVIRDKTIKREISNDGGDTNSVFNSDDDDKRTLKNKTENFTQNSPINQEPNEDMFSGPSATHSAFHSEANSDVDDNKIATHKDNIDVENVKDAGKIVSCVSNNENTLDNTIEDLSNIEESNAVITKDETYHLTSVIVHFGSVYGGHYVCYKYLDNRWFLTNDSHIEEVSESEVLSCNPYILFYEKSLFNCHRHN